MPYGLTWWELAFALVVVHYLADFPLQGPFLSEAKNHTTALGQVWWKHGLFAHSIIHAGGIFLITHSFILAMVELAMHARIDYLKCSDRIDLNIDQLLHLSWKLVYVIIVYVWATLGVPLW